MTRSGHGGTFHPVEKTDLILTLALSSALDPRTVRRWLANTASVSRSSAKSLEMSAEKLGLTTQVAEVRGITKLSSDV